MLSATEKATYDYLTLTCQSSEWVSGRDDRYILWKDIRQLKQMLDMVHTAANDQSNITSIRIEFYNYIDRLLGSNSRTITIVPSITHRKIFKTLKDVTSVSTFGARLEIHMQLYDTQQRHRDYGEYIAWTTHLISM